MLKKINVETKQLLHDMLRRINVETKQLLHDLLKQRHHAMLRRMYVVKCSVTFIWYVKKHKC